MTSADLVGYTGIEGYQAGIDVFFSFFGLRKKSVDEAHSAKEKE